MGRTKDLLPEDHEPLDDPISTCDACEGYGYTVARITPQKMGSYAVAMTECADCEGRGVVSSRPKLPLHVFKPTETVLTVRPGQSLHLAERGGLTLGNPNHFEASSEFILAGRRYSRGHYAIVRLDDVAEEEIPF
jgi:hypothetical protein